MGINRINREIIKYENFSLIDFSKKVSEIKLMNAYTPKPIQIENVMKLATYE